MRYVCSQGNVAETNRLIGTFNRPLAAGEFQILFGSFEQVSGDLGAFFLDLVEALHDGCAANGEAARTVGAHAERHGIGVAVDDIHVFDGNAELIGHHLGKGSFMALAVRVATDEDRHFAAGSMPSSWAAVSTRRSSK